VLIFHGLGAATRNIAFGHETPLRLYGASLFFQEK
jgi:hypothetical protein